MATKGKNSVPEDVGGFGENFGFQALPAQPQVGPEEVIQSEAAALEQAPALNDQVWKEPTAEDFPEPSIQSHTVAEQPSLPPAASVGVDPAIAMQSLASFFSNMFVNLHQGVTIEQMLSLLDEKVVEGFRTAAGEVGCPMHVWIAGILHLLGDQGRYNEVDLNPAWLNVSFGPASAAPVHATPLKATCENCNRSYKPDRQGRRFCCNLCGKRAVGYIESGPQHDPDCPTLSGTLKALFEPAPTVGTTEQQAV